MAGKTGNTYTAAPTTDRIEILGGIQLFQYELYDYDAIDKNVSKHLRQ